MDKSDNVQLNHNPIQINNEHMQQIQQLQFQHAIGNIQVKQEYQGHNSTSDIKNSLLDLNSQAPLHSMQLIESQSQGPHQSSSNLTVNPQCQTSLNALASLQSIQSTQLPVDWQQNRLQVLPQTIQNFPLQHLYTTASQPVVMSGNILGNQQQIQLITTGKPFPGTSMSGQQILPNASQNKQVIGNSQTINNAYTLPANGQSQTLVLSSFIPTSGQHQQTQHNLMQTVTCNQNNNKSTNQSDQISKQILTQKVLQKTNTLPNSGQNIHTMNTSNGQQCIQVSQTQIPAQILNPMQQSGTQTAMHFSTGPWIQGSVPFLTTNSIQNSTLLAPNSIVIRGTTADGSHGMLIQQPSNFTQQSINPNHQQGKKVFSFKTDHRGKKRF